MLFGFTEIEAVGAAGGGGAGGGGAGAFFFPQAPSAKTAPSAMISRNHFMRCCFTLFLPTTFSDFPQGQTKRI
jgi:hypothetical protein